MSERLNAVVRIHYADPARAERLLHYLDPQTRPDFPDEVPAHEAAWVDAFEFALEPAFVERPDAKTVVAGFGQDSDLSTELEDLCRAIALTTPDLVISWSDWEAEDTWIERWAAGESSLLWSQRRDGDEATPAAPILDDRLETQLQQAWGEPQRCLALMADHLARGDDCRAGIDHSEATRKRTDDKKERRADQGIDLSAWRTDDPQWLKARKQQWKFVHARLKGIGFERGEPFYFIRKGDHKRLKEFFFTGTYPPPAQNDEMATRSYDPGNPLKGIDGRVLFELWLHPDCSEDNWERIHDKWTNGTDQSLWHTGQRYFLESLSRYPLEGTLYDDIESEERLFSHFCRRTGVEAPKPPQLRAGLQAGIRAFFRQIEVYETDENGVIVGHPTYGGGDAGGLAPRVVDEYVRAEIATAEQDMTYNRLAKGGYLRLSVCWSLIALGTPDTYTPVHLEVANRIVQLIDDADLPDYLQEDVARGRACAEENLAERQRLITALEESNWKKRKAASQFGVPGARLNEFISKHRIVKPECGW